MIEIPDWRRRLRDIEHLLARLEMAKYPEDAAAEMSVELPLIRKGLEALKVDVPQLEQELAAGVADGGASLDVFQHDSVIRIEGLLRRTEARVFAIADSYSAS